ncbi:MAG TPA: DsrE family protein [Chitinophagaceae bacterium]|nr:DsrE family protein [Chitinophagaceae bacterium]
MKQILFTIVFSWIFFNVSFAESRPGDTVTLNQKFYFPVSLYDDPNAFNKAISGVAEKVISGLTDKEKKEYRNMTDYYMLAGNYQKAIEAIDSMQKKRDDSIAGMDYKIYSNARIKEKANQGSFDKIFKQDYENAFNKLSFKKRVAVTFDSGMLIQAKKEYNELIQKLKKNKEDSLSTDDAKELCHKYSTYTYYNQIYSIVSPIINTPQYQAMYPAVKEAKFMAGVMPVKEIDEKPDPNIRYKLLMELTSFDDREEASKEINGPLGEVARKINLHVAAGIPKNRIDLVLVVHAGALFAFMSNEKYKRKYGIDNPNTALIKELQNFGAKIIVCGQAMTWLHLEKSDMLPGIQQALTAQTVLSTYELKGYKFYNVSW